MLLAIDIGNTNIVLGVHDGTHWKRTWRAQTVRERMPDEYASLFRAFLRQIHLDPSRFDQIVIASVVPQLTEGIAEVVFRGAGQIPLIVSHRLNLGIILDVDEPSKIGVDRLADAVAAYERFGSNCIVVDMGTATVFTIVREPGVLLGGAIATGLRTSAVALAGRTAQLPQVALTMPPSPVARNTIHAIQSGIMFGHLALVEGLVERMRAVLGEASVIATGGWSRILAPHTACFDAVDQTLTLEGLRLIAERNR
jgi:type III pantothenate kinase